MNLPPGIKQLDAKLQGLPDTILSVILLALGGLALWTALFAPPVFKAALAAWFIAP